MTVPWSLFIFFKLDSVEGSWPDILENDPFECLRVSLSPVGGGAVDGSCWGGCSSGNSWEGG